MIINGLIALRTIAHDTLNSAAHLLWAHRLFVLFNGRVLGEGLMQCWQGRELDCLCATFCTTRGGENSSLSAVQHTNYLLGLGPIKIWPTLPHAHFYASCGNIETCTDSHVKEDAIRALGVVCHDISVRGDRFGYMTVTRQQMQKIG